MGNACVRSEVAATESAGTEAPAFLFQGTFPSKFSRLGQLLIFFYPDLYAFKL